MFFPSFSEVFYIRDLWISDKVSPCLRGMSLELTVLFCDEFGMGWCDFPVDCGNSIEVRTSTGLSAPRFREAFG